MASCYLWVDGPKDWSMSPLQKCGPSTTGIQFCCSIGDTCLEDSICHYTHSANGGSGYYLGGCTDSSFPEPCSKSCSGAGPMLRREVVFVNSTSLWACCYQKPGDELDCSNPGNETFYAPSPESLKMQGASSSTPSVSSTSRTSSIASSLTSSTPSASSPPSTSSASSTSSTSSASSTSSTSSNSTFSPSESSTPPPASTPPAPSSNFLSASAKLGICIAASVVGLGIIFALGFFFLWKRRPQPQQENRAYESDKSMSSPMARQSHPGELDAEQRAELDGTARPELDGRSKMELDGNARSELDGRSKSELDATGGDGR